MDQNREVDLLVIGQGLAGSALAIHALDANFRLLVIDQPDNNRSSRVAAGLFNPVTGRKMSKTWLADDLFPYLRRYYTDLEERTGRHFFYPLPVYRAFGSVQEQNEWMIKSGEEAYVPYVSNVFSTHTFGDRVNDRYGGIMLKECGYLNTLEYLASVRDYLDARNSYQEDVFDPQRLEIAPGFIRYGAVTAKWIIFCQGVDNATNPWFGYLPIRALKGEFLTIQCEWEKDVILNRGVYMVPGSGHSQWRVGATFNREDNLRELTVAARLELSRKLETLIRMPYSVTGQEWGFRPTTPDRRPILGAHPNYDALLIFNGLGTKGVSLAPYFSAVLIRWLEGKGMINKEADVSRF